MNGGLFDPADFRRPGPVPPGVFPRTRSTDPATSREAAAATAGGAKELEDRIVRYVADASRPVNAFEIASVLAGNRWDEGTIRTAVSRCVRARSLWVSDELGVSPRGRACLRYVAFR